MKIVLEDKIRENLDFFEEEPEAGHAARFASQLGQNRKKRAPHVVRPIEPAR